MLQSFNTSKCRNFCQRCHKKQLLAVHARCRSPDLAHSQRSSKRAYCHCRLVDQRMIQSPAMAGSPDRRDIQRCSQSVSQSTSSPRSFTPSSSSNVHTAMCQQSCWTRFEPRPSPLSPLLLLTACGGLESFSDEQVHGGKF